MENIHRGRRSSAVEIDISQLENEIMQKSGINLATNSDTKSPGSAQAQSKKETPAPAQVEKREIITPSGGNFVSGTEEDINVEENYEVDEQADLDKLMEEKFDSVLDRRDDNEEEEETTVAEHLQTTDASEEEKKEVEAELVTESSETTPASEPAEEVK